MHTTGKTRAFRIQLDYYHKLDQMVRWKLAATLLAAVAAVICLGLITRTPTPLSPGRLSAPHAVWQAECQVCHRSRSGIVKSLAATWTTDEEIPDNNCTTCHAGPAHHHTQFVDEVPSCASCHVEHRGANADITRVVDRVCTECHRDIAAHTDAETTPFEDVSNFDHHPNFTLPDEDPSNLKFTHSRHITAGLVLDADERQPMKWGDVPVEYREKHNLQDKPDKELVTLGCHVCHELDRAGDVGSARNGEQYAAVGPPPAGAYMRPINYERHCSDCHPIFDLDSKQQIRHGLRDTEMDELLKGIRVSRLADRVQSRRTLPSWIPGKLSIERSAANTGRLLELVAKAKDQLSGVCQKCHHLDDHADSVLSFRVTAIPAVWFSQTIPRGESGDSVRLSAAFDHSTHRAMECKACHEDVGIPPAGEFATFDEQAIAESNQVLVPRKKSTCHHCHQPRRRDESNRAVGGAGHNCVECHRYHGGDEGIHGPGANIRAPSSKLDVQQFLTGERHADGT